MRSIAASSEMTSIFGDALRYWERWRIAYNAILVLVVAEWVLVSWPHFRGVMTMHSLLLLTILGAVANVCYSAAYVPDIAFQFSTFQAGWKNWRWTLWLAGMLFAILLANYWIGDEIYPFMR